MKHLRLIGVALVAVLAMSAVVVASASAAEPEFGRCKKEAGKFKDAKCDEETGTEFNWVPLKAGEKVKYDSSSGAGTLETHNLEKITCTSDTNEGELTGPKSGTVVVTFLGCESSGFKCKSSGQAAGTIVTNTLETELGYINAAKHEVGLSLKPKGELFVEFECVGGIIKVKTRGSVIGRMTPILEMSETSLLVFTKTGDPCSQEITAFEKLATDTLESSKNGGAFEGACEETTDVITLLPAGELLEIKA